MSSNNSERDISSSPTNHYNSLDTGLQTSSGYSSNSTENYTSNKNTDDTNQSISKPFKEKKVYQCKECSKFFNRPSALETHTYSHTQEKPFQCSSHNCDKRFSVVSNLRRHLKIHQKSYNSGNKISSQDRIRCVRKLTRRNSRNTKATDQDSSINCYDNVTNTTLRYKPKLLQKPEVLQTSTILQPNNEHNLSLPPIATENTITHYFHDSRVTVPSRISVPSYMCRAILYPESQSVDQLIGERSAAIEYQPSDIQNDLNAMFTNFDDFSFLQQS